MADFGVSMLCTNQSIATQPSNEAQKNLGTNEANLVSATDLATSDYKTKLEAINEQLETTKAKLKRLTLEKRTIELKMATSSLAEGDPMRMRFLKVHMIRTGLSLMTMSKRLSQGKQLLIPEDFSLKEYRATIKDWPVEVVTSKQTESMPVPKKTP